MKKRTHHIPPFAVTLSCAASGVQNSLDGNKGNKGNKRNQGNKGNKGNK